MANVSRADTAKRLDRTTELLAFHTDDEVVRKLCRQFKVVKQTSRSWIAQVHKRILANIQKPRQEWVAETLHQLNQIIRTEKDKRVKLDALKQRTCLLGLNAPTNIRLQVEGIYQGPEQWKALGDPAFRERALALEIEYARLKVTANGNEQGNGGGAPPGAPGSAAQQLRLFGLPALPISSSPPGPPEGGAEFIAVSGPPSADRGDAGPLR